MSDERWIGDKSGGWIEVNPRYEIRVTHPMVGGPMTENKGEVMSKGIDALTADELSEPLPEAKTLVYTDDRGLWVEVVYQDPDDGQRHAQRTRILDRGVVFTGEQVQEQITGFEEILAHGLKQNRASRRRESAPE